MSNRYISIKQLPEQERPREKLLHYGAQYLSDVELLAIILRTGTFENSAMDVARSLMHKFQSLGALMQADTEAMCTVSGLGPAKSAQIKAVFELAQRQLKEEIQAKQYLKSSSKTRDYLRLRYQHRHQEVFSCVFLDSQHGVITVEELFEGSIDRSHVYPRELVKKCLQHNASAVIFAHNHPSGVAEPSQSDIHLTQNLQKALELIDIRVLDHLIIGNTVTSFADQGLI